MKQAYNFFLKNIYIFFPIVFFLIALFTLYDYGINWDSPVHFARGQAFFRYLTTGQTNYKNLPSYCIGKDKFTARVDYKTGEACDLHRKIRVSEYQSTILDYNFFKKDIYGHPPLSDILSTAGNQVFFITLGWIQDVPSYNLFSIFATFVLALTVAIWSKKTLGTFAAVVATLVLYLFPLLLGEQHFNVKDPAMAAFLTLSLFLLWVSFSENKPTYLYLSAIAGGISFGTKFNFVFAPFILFPWFIAFMIYLVKKKIFKKYHSTSKQIVGAIYKKFPRKFIPALLLYPCIIFTIFYFTWPVLWSDPINNILLVVKFYKDIGTTACSYEVGSLNWLLNCVNPTAIMYFLITLPLVSLFFFFIGFIRAFVEMKKYTFATLLWLSFWIFTIGRVTMPGSSIYGGIRQIMEFIGPTAMIAGLGALFVRNFISHFMVTRLSKKMQTVTTKRIVSNVISIAIILCFVPISIKMIMLHPNENIYFNPLVGGLHGAYEKNIYGYGNTYGNAYYQGVEWLNKHAKKNGRISLIWGLDQNISRSSVRADLTHLGVSRSGYQQQGEYLLTTLEQGNPIYGTFRYKYANRFLNPVYTLMVEDVPLLEIWENTQKYIKKDIDFSEKEITDFTTEVKNNVITLKMASSGRLKRLEWKFSSQKCKDTILGVSVYTSVDGTTYERQGDEINDFTAVEISPYHTDYAYLFAGDNARYIQLVLPPHFACTAEDITFSPYIFTHLYKHE